MGIHQTAAFECLVENVIKAYKGVGLAVAIIDAKQTHYQKFWGFRDLEAELPVDASTVFGLASITKSFTCLAIMQLQEAGKLKVSDPVTAYIPEFSYPGTGVLTVENLMAHNGGYEPQPALRWSIMQHTEMDDVSETEKRQIAKWDQIFPVKRMDSFADMIAHLSDAQQQLLGSPGEVFSYSNDTYGVLGEIIKRVSGAASYEEYMEENILKPLGMERSLFAAEDLVDMENVTKLYVIKKDNPQEFPHWQAAPAFTPCGFLKSTLDDMKKYLSMYIQKGNTSEKRLLSTAGIADMLRPRQPSLHQRYYGYGLSIQSVDDIHIIEHGGSLSGVSTHIAWSPEIGKGVVVLCNTSGVPVAKIATAALMWCNEQPVDRERISFRKMNWSKEMCEALVGDYLAGEGSTYQISLDEIGKPQIRFNEEETWHQIEPVLPELGLVKIKMNETELRPLFNDQGYIWAMMYGNRTVPRRRK